ncbi:MAG: molybdate ABC transporter substrate-binding protein [Syntrophaceae bacterium]|nr:molybdate ABC transporter substrate-binding protein [Syntrophaceae bacterium]
MKKLLMIFAMVILCAGQSLAADLIIFSGAGLMKPMEELKKNFESTQKVTVDIHYGGSGEIFAQVGAGQPCDVLIPGAEKYTNDALKNGWVIKETIRPMVRHIPVIAVPKGNPAKVNSLEDLVRSGVRISIGDPKAPAIGRVAKQILEKNKLWESVTPNISVYAPTVNQLLIYVALKQVDAAIIWGDMVVWAEGKGKLDVVRIPEDKNIIQTIPTAVCTKAPHKDLALKFNNYISSPEGLAVWKKWGYETCTR